MQFVKVYRRLFQHRHVHAQNNNTQSQIIIKGRKFGITFLTIKFKQTTVLLYGNVNKGTSGLNVNLDFKPFQNQKRELHYETQNRKFSVWSYLSNPLSAEFLLNLMWKLQTQLIAAVLTLFSIKCNWLYPASTV